MENDVLTIENGVVTACRKDVVNLVIPAGVTKIGFHAFKDCDAVEKIVSSSPLFPFSEKTQKLYDITKKTKKIVLVASASKEMMKKAKIAQVQNVSASAVLESILRTQAECERQMHRRRSDGAELSFTRHAEPLRNRLCLLLGCRGWFWRGLRFCRLFFFQDMQIFYSRIRFIESIRICFETLIISLS